MLHVDKVDSVFPEKVHITASGLEAFRCYKFQLVWHYENGKYYSYCVIKSNEHGNIDLARDKPIRGTYYETDKMGLFSSLHPTDEIKFGHYIRNYGQDPFYYTLKLLSDSEEVLDQLNLRKLWMHPALTRIEVAQNGMYGTIFKPPGPGPFPCIIDVPGGNGRLPTGQAAVFAASGFLVYTFAVFFHEDLPNSFQDVDVETFSKHIRFVQSLPYCSNKIGLFGVCQAGIMANLLASRHSDISAVAAVNPPEAFYREISLKVDGSPMKVDSLDLSLAKYINRVSYLRPTYQETFDKFKPEAKIKWENIPKKTKFRIVVTLDDYIFPCISNLANIRNNLLETGHSVEVQLVPSGHVFFVPNFPHIPFGYNKFLKIQMGFGGECNLVAKSQEVAWENHIKFFKKHLGTPPELPDFEREKRIVLPGKGSKL
ncbi:unnamed protein product [Caenorhabditis brenneri]